MLSRRPASASRAPTITEQELLQKIGLLADHHARNVQALHRLRRTAWTAGDQVRKTGVSKDDSKLFCTRPTGSRRTFTRVATSAAESSWKHTPTVVEPFRSMETHTTAWKRKMRKHEEVSTRIMLIPQASSRLKSFIRYHHTVAESSIRLHKFISSKTLKLILQ